MKKLSVISVLLFVIVFLQACYYDKEQLLIPPNKDTYNCLNYSFTNEVSPILQQSCSNGSGCHGSGSSNGPGELITYTEIKNAAKLIQAAVLAGRMPLGSSLTTTQIQTINCWIGNGSLNN